MPLLILILLACLLVLLGGGLGLGFLINWLFPSIDLGSAVVAGTLTSAGTAVVLMRLFTAIGQSHVSGSYEDEDDREFFRQMEMFTEYPSRRSSKRRKKR